MTTVTTVTTVPATTVEKIASDLLPLLVPIADLDLLPGNPRRGDVAAVARSYDRFSQTKPIVARHWEDGKAYVVAGNHQLLAARKLGWKKIAVVWRDDLSADEARALALADNHTSDLGSYDDQALLKMLQSIAPYEDLFAATSYTDEDIARLLGEVGQPPPPAYEEKFQVVVDCKDEADQERLYERLTAEGYSCRVLQL